MRLSFYFICLMLFCILVCSYAHTVITTDSLINLILNIRKFYTAATVIFTHHGDKYEDYGDLEIAQLVHSCTHTLGRNYIMSLDAHFRELNELFRYYHHVIVRPLAIVLLSSFNDLLEFVEVTKTFPMSFPVWFVLFLYSPTNNTSDYCHQPIGNLFNLSFDTQMLVMCKGDDIMREWYSVRGEDTKIYDVAKWTGKTGFTVLTKLRFYDRRRNLEGTVLRAVVVKDAPIFPPNKGDYVGGLYNKVLIELTHALNFTLKIVKEVDEHGMWKHKGLGWSGAMGEVVSGHADFVIADMTMTSLRIRDVDFTLPLIISRDKLFIKEPTICGVKWFGYFQTFSLSTWSAIIMVIAITPFLLSIMKVCRGSRNIMELMSDNFICIWGIFCQQSLTEFPRCSSLRLAYLTIFCTAILTTAYYSAALVCFLTACTRVLPFRTLEEFIKDGTYKLIMPYGSADYDIVLSSHDLFSKKLVKLMKKESELPASIIDGFMQVCNENKVAFLVLNALKKSVEMRIPCRLSIIGTKRMDNLGLVLSKNNPYTGVINYHLQKFSDNGILMRLRRSFYTKQTEIIVHEPVHLISVVPILAILCIGIILSITILIIERFHYRNKKKRFQSKVFYPSKKPLFIKKR